MSIPRFGEGTSKQPAAAAAPAAAQAPDNPDQRIQEDVRVFVEPDPWSHQDLECSRPGFGHVVYVGLLYCVIL